MPQLYSIHSALDAGRRQNGGDLHVFLALARLSFAIYRRPLSVSGML
jgi:hypothetical protein